jgi:tetratricopeptide (TPR) repeat protein
LNRPTKIGKYEVIDVIGRGGMGVVYKATDPHLDRLVAIKMMTAGYGEDPDLLKRFLREAQSTARLQHSNIVTVYDSGEQDGSPYLVMEYLEGESLDAVISARRGFTVLEKVQFIVEACHGLSYAHERGIVHRDIKPANIMLSKNGAVKLVDFGIAHVASNTLTRTGQIMGSIHYMSPEQINGISVDARSDIFSTGVVLYQLFTYSLPFEAESTAATLLKIIHDPPPPLEKFLATYPKELESIILRALAKNREDRYSSADEFALDLLQVHEQLKHETVNRHLREAEALLGKGELGQARDHLLQLLKLDQKHTQAIKLLRLVQQRIEKEQGGEQARQLRAKAEESYSQGQFEAALRYLDQAVALDTFNPELPKFRDVVREAKLKAEGLQQALRRAETAHERGDLDAARQAADEALEISADNTEAKALYRIIHRDWVERSRQRQLESLLEAARKEISARNLTAALNILKQAEPLDPQGAQVHALIEEVLAGREQERRRKELEGINREAEEALNRDDYEAASAVLAEGLRQFPQDRGLIQLKALAERQRAAADKKLFVRQQITAAKQSLEAGHAAEALTCLQSALQKVPHEPQLEALLTMVKERVIREEQEERRKELERINREVEQAVSREDYETASAKIGEGLRRFPQELSLIQLKELVERQYAAAQRETFVSQQMAAARRLLDASQAAEALALLRTALQKVPQEPQLQTLLGMVQERVARDEAEQAKSRSVQQAREALGKHAFGEAIRILEAAQVRFVHATEIDDLLRFAREQEQKETERRTVEDATRRSHQWIAEYQFERAIQLLETTLSQVPHDQLRATLEETRRRRDDYQRDLQAAIAKAQQFLREGTANKAVDLLAAQPEFYSRSPEFGVVLETARKQQIVETVERQVASEPDLDRQVQILENAQKKYPAHANWQQHLQPIREQRKLALSIVQQARKLERGKKYDKALQEWQRLQSVYGRYPGLPQELDRLTRLDEEVRVRALAAAQEKAVRQQSVAVVTPPPVIPDPTIDQEAEVEAAPIVGSEPVIHQVPTRIMTLPRAEKLEADAHDLRVSWTANRRNLTAGGIAALVVFGALAATVWMRPGKTTQVASVSVPPNTESPVSQPVAAPATSTLAPSNSGSSTASNKALDREAAIKASPVGKPEPAAKREKITASDGNNNSSSAQPVSPPVNSKPLQSASNVPSASGSPTTSSVTQPVASPQTNLANQGNTTIASNQSPSVPSAAIGNPFPQPPPPAVNPTPKVPESLSVPSISPEKEAIRTALRRYKEAYESESVDELLKIWPSLSRDQRKALKQGFDKAQAVRVELECGEPSIAGASAQVKCAQSMRYTEKGKVLPYQKVSVDIMLRKAAGSWLVDNVQAN